MMYYSDLPSPPAPAFDEETLQGLAGDIESAFEEGCAKANAAFNELYYTLRDMGGDTELIAHHEKSLDNLFEYFSGKLSEVIQELRDDISKADGSSNPFSRNFDGD